MTLSILYRGPLSSCNYDCSYCPFAKRRDSRATLATDSRQLAQFVEFVRATTDFRFKILFTPWGEGMIRRHYQQAIVALSHMEHVEKVAIQTNLSAPLGWLRDGCAQKIGLWTTFHPTQATRESFVRRCRQLDDLNIGYSVGVVGLREHIKDIEELKARLPGKYVWINAFKDNGNYYTTEEQEHLVSLDPHIVYNLSSHDSYGKACMTGHTVISVDGDGNIYRCHFIKERLGNIYDASFRDVLVPRLCTKQSCSCHIGYVHMNHLDMYRIYDGRELERIA